MSGGLAALLDDVAAIAKAAAASVDDVTAAAAKASAKAAGVVVDDAAVTPQYVTDVTPDRELPIIWKIAKGSLVNKLLIILPVAIVLSQFVPWLLTPILMLGGSYLCFEGAEKVIEWIRGEHHDEPAAAKGATDEKKLVSGAVRTDLILSAEIMVISLNGIAALPLLQRIATLALVGVLMTAVVYGAVAILVKMDDLGLAMMGRNREGEGAHTFGRRLVAAMPSVLNVISVVGVFAMIWVGGHLLLEGINTFGFHAIHNVTHHLAEAVAHWPAGGFVGWLIDTAFSLVAGFIWGCLIVGVVHLIAHRGGRGTDHAPAGASDPASEAAPATGATSVADAPQTARSTTESKQAE